MALDSSKLAALRAKISQSTGTVASQPQTTALSNEIPSETSSNNSILSISNSSSSSSQGPDDISRILDNSITKSSQSSIAIGSNEISFEHLEFKSKLGELEGMLLIPHPRMPVLLREIHTQLAKDPEIVTLMTEDEIGILVNGLKKQTSTELSGAVAKQSKTKDKKVAITVDML